MNLRLILLGIALIAAVGGTSNSAAQQTYSHNLRLHASTSQEEVWTIPGTADSARESLLQLAVEIHETTLDCSHLVHELFERAGLPYPYAPSVDLYKGQVTAFRRTGRPQPGDIVVWMGHVGVVVDSEAKLFVSALRTGVKISAYDSHYWKNRGRPRFFRYALDREGSRAYTRVARNHGIPDDSSDDE